MAKGRQYFVHTATTVKTATGLGAARALAKILAVSDPDRLALIFNECECGCGRMAGKPRERVGAK